MQHAVNEEYEVEQLLTLSLDDQLFGVPIDYIRDIFKSDKLAPVPLASHEIVGLVNLRGRIVPTLGLRQRLGLSAESNAKQKMMIALEVGGEPYSFMVDSVGEVISVPKSSFEKNPVTLDPKIKECAQGIYKLDSQLLVVLDVNRLLISTTTSPSIGETQ